jgi:hypothetical protein
MPSAASKINPCLWFDTEAEEAARFYCSIFKNSKVGTISRYGSEGKEIHGKEAGSVMVVEFELDGERFAALNGGPQFKLRRPEGSRLFLGEAVRWRRGRTVRLAEGPIRPLLAGRAQSPVRDADGPGPGEVRAGHESLPANDEIRHRRARARLCGPELRWETVT